MTARPPFLRLLPADPDGSLRAAEQTARHIAGEAHKLHRSRDAAAAEALAIAADALRRELLRAAQALRAEGAPPHAA